MSIHRITRVIRQHTRSGKSTSCFFRRRLECQRRAMHRYGCESISARSSRSRHFLASGAPAPPPSALAWEKIGSEIHPREGVFHYHPCDTILPPVWYCITTRVICINTGVICLNTRIAHVILYYHPGDTVEQYRPSPVRRHSFQEIAYVESGVNEKRKRSNTRYRVEIGNKLRPSIR